MIVVRRLLAALLASLLVAGCGGGSATIGSIPPVRMCAARVFQGMPVIRDDLVNGCTRTDGTLMRIPWQFCPGPPPTALAHLRFESGDFWGVGGSWWHRAADLADDQEYREAVEACRGQSAAS